MTGRQLKAALRRLGFTQETFARYLDVSTSSVARWCQERSRIPHAVVLLLQTLHAKDVPSARSGSRKRRRSPRPRD